MKVYLFILIFISFDFVDFPSFYRFIKSLFKVESARRQFSGQKALIVTH